MVVRRKVFLILMLVWMAVIFAFSCRTGVESTGDSYQIGMTVGRLVVPAFHNLSSEEQLAFAERVDHPVRKTAHALEYAVLGAFAAGWIYDEKRRRGINILWAWLAAAVYAATDEIHQLFVPGRSGQLTDVLLDSAGALAGVLFMAGILYLIRRGRSSRDSEAARIAGK